MSERIQPKRALVSVADKTELVDFCRVLAEEFGVELISTGGTAKLLQENNIPVKKISDLTGFPEIFDGRVKTLHPKVHGGLLMRRQNGKDVAEAEKNEILPIDMIVVNLYPFNQTTSKEGVTEEEAIEEIDIGGVALLRAAAKNFQEVAVVTAIRDYTPILDEMRHKQGLSLQTRRNLSIKAFEKTCNYDKQISEYFKNKGETVELLDLHYEKSMKLRYGENPHQRAAFFKDPTNHYPNVTNAKTIQANKEISFNNILDGDAAIKIVTDFENPTVAVMKHTNPCGVATAEDIDTAFETAYNVDPMSAFGCVIGLNQTCTEKIAQYIADNKLFVELIVAPDFEEGALEIFKKRKNLRLLATGKLRLNPNQRDIKTVAGGMLVQYADQHVISKDDLKIVTKVKPTAEQIDAMMFARKVVKHVKSNAVVFAKNEPDKGIERIVAIGAGQMARVDAVFIARHKGGDDIQGSVLASDAFFPFPDGVEEAHKAGVTAIIQPGGSIRDEEVIKRADELGIAMVFTGVRSFKH